MSWLRSPPAANQPVRFIITGLNDLLLLEQIRIDEIMQRKMSHHKNSWAEDLNIISRSVADHFGSLDGTQLNKKPNASTWSIAQIIEHIISINHSYYPTFDNLLDGTHAIPWTGKFNFIVKFFGKMILKSVQPESIRKTKTLPIWEPSTSDIDLNVLTRFENSQEVLKEYISKLINSIDENVVISSPANKFVVYTLPVALDIIVTHEKRHLQQALTLANK